MNTCKYWLHPCIAQNSNFFVFYDIVLIQDSNAKRGQWKLGKISKVYKGEDGKVRRALVEYKNPKPGEKVTEYKGKGFTTIERPVNKLITILPASEDKWTISKHFGNNNSELLCVILKWFLPKTLNSL